MVDDYGLKLGELVTIVVAPREKHSTLPDSLTSLFQTIPSQVRVLACLPRLPAAIKAEVEAMIAHRGSAELCEFEADTVPHRARALGASLVKTPWLVFADNDLHYEAGWLDAMSDRMREEGVDVLAPLIFIGPPTATTIHHAGGLMEIETKASGQISAREKHRLMNVRIDEQGVAELLDSEGFSHCDVAEFHCLALRTALLEHELQLPPQLITREQQDLALQLQQLGKRVNFVPGSRVTYMAQTEFTEDDLRYHAARWSEARARESLDYMEATWHMEFDRQRVLYRWIQKHRRRPFIARGPAILKYLPGVITGHYLSRRYGYAV